MSKHLEVNNVFHHFFQVTPQIELYCDEIWEPR
jgi:hypothetical protein